MGFNDQPLWRLYRNHFPVTRHLVYLNHAGMAPLVKEAADAMREWAADALEFGALHYDAWMAACDALRASAAKLIGCEPAEIAIIKNTSEGIAAVAGGIAWRPGDKVVGFTEEFPANYFPWKRLESRGVRLELLSADSPLEKIEAACRGARLLAVSFVQYLSGRRMDLAAIGDICRRYGCIFFVDAIQGLGALPVNVRKMHISALAADGHKWLLGPEGCGILYINKDLFDLVEPVEWGWTNFANYGDYANRDASYRADAGRYECGTLNTAGCIGLRAALDFLLGVGVERIAAAVCALSERLAEGAAAKGYEVLSPRIPAAASGIVSVRKAGADSRWIVSRLREQGIIAAPRQGWIRFSPHFYISPDEVDRAIDLLP